MTGDTGTVGGTYTLLIEVLDPTTIEVGALGEREFDPGWYAYTGSALGPGGFARVQRHQELAAGERDARHWHVDYLLGNSVTSVDTVVLSQGADIECDVAGALDGEAVDDFGCSDCDCTTHLHYDPERVALLDSARRAHDAFDGTEPERRSEFGSPSQR